MWRKALDKQMAKNSFDIKKEIKNHLKRDEEVKGEEVNTLADPALFSAGREEIAYTPKQNPLKEG